MAAYVITLEDLEEFKSEILSEIRQIRSTLETKEPESNLRPMQKVWLKSHQVQRLLGISPGTLQTLRLNGTVPYTKVGGVLFYDEEEINKLFESNMRNKRLHV